MNIKDKQIIREARAKVFKEKSDCEGVDVVMTPSIIDFLLLIILAITAIYHGIWLHDLMSDIQLPFTIVGIVQLSLLVLQSFLRKCTKVYWPIVFGPCTLFMLPWMIKAVERTFNNYLKSKDKDEQNNILLVKYASSYIKNPLPNNVNGLIFKLLITEDNIDASISNVEKAITQTQNVVEKLESVTQTSSSLEQLIISLNGQIVKLQNREKELQQAKSGLTSQVGELTDRVEALDTARLAIHSLKLHESNNVLLAETEAVLECAKTMCLEWDNRVLELTQDTSVTLATVKEAGEEVYNVLA